MEETFRATLADVEFERQFVMPLMALEITPQQAARLLRQLSDRLARVPVQTHSISKFELRA